MGRQWPLPRGKFTITSRFAGRINPVTGRPESHSGTDFAAPDGTPFYACAGGTVQYIGAASGYGQWIVIDHPDSEGGGCSEYGHMWNAFATGLKQGQWVNAGQKIGYIGSNGQSTGPHLHLTVWERGYGGKRIDPETWLAGKPYPGDTATTPATPAPTTNVSGGGMKNWWKVEPEVYKLLNKHFTRGRAGSIQYIVRHHNAGVLTIDQIWDVWQTREASAHYQVEVGGRVGQLVNDSDTAWHAANATVNANSIGIEHANSAGAAQDWPISDATIVNGAKLAAALCWFYKLGRPNFGTNIRDHRQYTTTSCPHHLANGGKYHNRWMQVAQQHYDFMVANPNGAPNQGGFLMALSDAEQRELLAKTRDIHRELTQRYPSRSAYRTTDAPIDTLAGYVLNTDARCHEDWVHARAKEAGMTPTEYAKKLGGK